MKKLIFIILSGLFLISCAQLRHLEYTPFVYDIDGKNELSISTYPAWFAKDLFSIPFVYKQRETHDKLYFQVYIRDINKKSGKNPNVESIRIHSFSYRIMQTTTSAEKKLRWDIIFFFNALAAAMFSFSGITPVAAGVAKGLCYTFSIFFILSLFDWFFQKAVK